MRQKVVRDIEKKTQQKLEQKGLHWNLGEGEEGGKGIGDWTIREYLRNK
jgi:hypothetical protein